MFESLIRKNFIKKMKLIEQGSISITFPDNQIQIFKGKKSGVNVDIHLKDLKVIVNLINKGDIGFARDYRDGYWSTTNLENLFIFALENQKLFHLYRHGNFWLRKLYTLLYLTKRNSIKGSKKNIEAHYDLGNDFYKIWLDKTMTYSSAIFDSNITLEDAQINKYKQLLNKIPKDSKNILEVGCGWGGFAEMAGKAGYNVKAITLSKQQLEYAKNRTNHLPVNVCLEDYRHQTGKYDAIVSIEMFEAVGRNYWNTYFAKLAELINDNGKILLQIITIDDNFFGRYSRNSDMIRTLIFPGGMLPCESALLKIISRYRLKVDSIYRFGKDYAKTMRIWLESFDNEYAKFKQLNFTDEFIRLWRFYLSICTAGFEFGRTNVIQLELSKQT